MSGRGNPTDASPAAFPSTLMVTLVTGAPSSASAAQPSTGSTEPSVMTAGAVSIHPKGGVLCCCCGTAAEEHARRAPRPTAPRERATAADSMGVEWRNAVDPLDLA